MSGSEGSDDFLPQLSLESDSLSQSTENPVGTVGASVKNVAPIGASVGGEVVGEICEAAYRYLVDGEDVIENGDEGEMRGNGDKGSGREWIAISRENDAGKYVVGHVYNEHLHVRMRRRV